MPPPPKLRHKMLRKEPWMEDDNEAMRIFRQWLHFRLLAWRKAREERVLKRLVTLVMKALSLDNFIRMISNDTGELRDFYNRR